MRHYPGRTVNLTKRFEVLLLGMLDNNDRSYHSYDRLYQTNARYNLASSSLLKDFTLPNSFFRHAIGSCSMLPLGLNGVVSPRLKVLLHFTPH